MIGVGLGARRASAWGCSRSPARRPRGGSLLPGMLVALIGTGLFNPAVTNVALSSVPIEQSGVAAGVNDTFRQAGIAVGVAALGALIPAEARARRRLGGRVRQRPARRAVGRRRGSRSSGAVTAGAADLQALRRRGGDARRGAAAAARSPRLPEPA